MHKTYVTDITHFLDDQGVISIDMPDEARQFAEQLTNLVTQVTHSRMR